MKIIKGWRFCAADFSLQASGKAATGSVTLVRYPEEKERWHKMPDEMKEDNDGPPLYVRGHGTTVEGAVADALWAAAFADPIPDPEG